MKHPLEEQYGLSANELLDAIDKRFRAKITLEGAVAEVHLGKQIKDVASSGLIERHEQHDKDGYPDFTIWLPGSDEGIRVECKNVRDSSEAYRKGGEVVAYKVETQKTRTSKSDPSSRFYDKAHFEVLAVCLGKKTRQSTDFVFIWTKDLKGHPKYESKMAVMHPVPLSPSSAERPWFSSLEELVRSRAQ